jgi:hypothetical protein
MAMIARSPCPACRAARFGSRQRLGRQIKRAERQPPAQTQDQQPPEAGEERVAERAERRHQCRQHHGRAITMPGVETHHIAVAENPHQPVGRQQNPRLGQADAERIGVHRQ